MKNKNDEIGEFITEINNTLFNKDPSVKIIKHYRKDNQGNKEKTFELWDVFSHPIIKTP